MRITRQTQIKIDSEQSTVTPLVDRLFTKMAFDLSWDLTESECQYSHKAGVPSQVSCTQTVTGSGEDAVYASLSMTSTGQSRSEARSLNDDELVRCGLHITASGINDLVCDGDIDCVLDLIPDVALARTHAVKSQYVLRREISQLTTGQMQALLQSAQQKESSYLNYLFAEVANCQTAACTGALDYLAASGQFEAYPILYRAAIKNSSPKVLEAILNDITRDPSTEKVDLLADILSSNNIISSSEFTSLAYKMIPDDCSFTTTPSTLAGYFHESAQLDESALATWLKLANDFNVELPQYKMYACMRQVSSKPIAEQAIVNLASTLVPEEFVMLAEQTENFSQLSAMVYGLFRYGIEPMEIQRLFSNKGYLSDDLAILISTLGLTHSPADTTLWSHSMPISLPQSLAEIQQLSDLTLSSTAGSRNGAAIEVINRLRNGLGEDILEVDFIVNDMFEIMQLAVDSGVVFSNEEWHSILSTENALISLIEAVMNKQFDQLANTPIFPHLKNFIRMGGVTVKVYGDSVELGWIAEILHNIEQFTYTLSSDKVVPSVPELYQIFTSGLSRSYANVADSRSMVHVPLVNGMTLCQETASIMAVNYQGTLLPDLLTMGKSGKFMVAPSFTVGNVVQTAIHGLETSGIRVDVTDSHFSFDIQAEYDVSGDIMLKFEVAPTMSSPAHYQSQSFLSIDMPRGMNYYYKDSSDLIGSDIVLGVSDHGYEMYLAQAIQGQLKVAKNANIMPNFAAEVDSLGKLQLRTKGTRQNGAIQIRAQSASKDLYTALAKFSCSDITDCKIQAAADAQGFERLGLDLDMAIVPAENSINVKSELSYGSRTVYQVKTGFITTGDKTQAQLMLGSGLVDFNLKLKCLDTLATSRLTGIYVNPANLDCRIQLNGESGRVAVSADELTGRAVINTPVGSTKFYVSLENGLESALTVYKYDMGTFKQLEQMKEANLKRYEVFEATFAQKPETIFAKIELSKQQALAFQLQHGDESHKLKLQSKLMKLTLFSSLATENGQIMARQSLQWDQSTAEELTGLDLSYVSQGGNIYFMHQTSHNADYFDHCSGTTSNFPVTSTRFVLGESEACSSYSGQDWNQQLEVSVDSPYITYLPFSFALQSNYENSFNVELNLIAETLVNLKSLSQFEISSTQRDLIWRGKAVGSVLDQGFNYSAELSASVASDMSSGTGSLTYSINGSKNVFELTTTVDNISVASQSLQYVTITSPQQNFVNLLAVYCYPDADIFCIPVGFDFQSDSRDVNLVVLPSSQYATFTYSSDENIKAEFELQSSVAGISLKVPSYVNAQAKVDIEAIKVKLLIESGPIRFTITDNNTRPYNHQIDLSWPSNNINVDIYAVGAQLNNLELVLSDFNLENFGVSGQGFVKANETGLQKLAIDHDIRVFDNTLHATIGYSIPSSESVQFSQDDEFKICEQSDLQSYAWIEAGSESFGIWGTYDSSLSEVCANAIRKGGKCEQQLVYNYPTHEFAFTSEAEDILHTGSLKYAGETAELCYAGNCATGTISLQDQSGAISIDLPAFEANGQITALLEDNTLEIVGSVTHQSNRWDLTSQHTLNNYGLTSKSELTGSHRATQNVVITWKNPFLVQIEHSSMLGELSILSENDIQQQDFVLTANFDILDQQLDSAVKVSLGQSVPIIELTSAGLILSNKVNIESEVNAAGLRVQAFVGEFSHVTVVDFNDVDVETLTEFAGNSLEVSKKGYDASIKLSATFPVSIEFSASTKNYNELNQAYLQALTTTVFDVMSDMKNNRHTISLYGDKVNAIYDQGEYESNGQILSLKWALNGLIVSSVEHQAELSTIYTVAIDKWQSKDIPVDFSYSLNVPAQTAALSVSNEGTFLVDLTGAMNDQMFNGVVTLSCEQLNVEGAQVNAGFSKKGDFILDLMVPGDNSFVLNYDENAVSLDLTQNFYNVLPSLNADWTPSTLNLNVQPYVGYAGKLAYDLESLMGIFVLKSRDGAVDIDAKFDSGLVILGNVFDYSLDITVDNDYIGTVKVTMPSALIQFSNSQDSQVIQTSASTLQILCSTTCTEGVIVGSMNNNAIKGKWNSDEVQIKGVIYGANGELCINWTDIEYKLLVEGVIESQMKTPGSNINFSAEVNNLFTTQAQLDYENYVLATKGQIENNKWAVKISVPEALGKAKVIVNGETYTVDLTENEGSIELSDLASMKYDQEKFQLIVENYAKIQVMLDKYQTVMQLGYENYQFKLANDGLDFANLQVQLSEGDSELFALQIKNRNELDITEASSGLVVHLTVDDAKLSGYINCEAAELELNINEIAFFYYAPYDLYLPETMSLVASYQEFPININVEFIESGFTAKLSASDYIVLNTHQQLFISPVSIDSRLDVEAAMVSFNSMLKYKNGKTNAGLKMNTPMLQGKFMMKAKGLTIKTLSVQDFLVNTSKLPVAVKGGFNYQNGEFTLESTQIREQGSSGAFYFGLSKPITITSSGLEPVSTKIIISEYRFNLDYEDIFNFSFKNYKPSEALVITAVNGQYDVIVDTELVQITSKTVPFESNKSQSLLVTMNGDQVFATIIQLQQDNTFTLQAKSGEDRQVSLVYNAGTYELAGKYEGIFLFPYFH